MSLSYQMAEEKRRRNNKALYMYELERDFTNDKKEYGFVSKQNELLLFYIQTIEKRSRDDLFIGRRILFDCFDILKNKNIVTNRVTIFEEFFDDYGVLGYFFRNKYAAIKYMRESILLTDSDFSYDIQKYIDEYSEYFI